MIPIIEKLLADKALEEGEEYEYIPVDPVESIEPVSHSTQKRGEVPAVATLVEHIKSLK